MQEASRKENIMPSTLTKSVAVYGDLLISVVGNIASGKTTLCKELSSATGIKYMEINNLTTYHGNLILESSGLGRKLNEVKQAYHQVLTILVEVSKSETMERLEQRSQNSYIYPVNTVNPEQFYRNHIRDFKRVYDLIYQYEHITLIEIVNVIEAKKRGGGVI